MFLEVFENNNLSDSSWALGSPKIEQVKNLIRELAGEHCTLLISCFRSFSKPLWISGSSLSSFSAWHTTPIWPSPSWAYPIPLDPCFIYNKLFTVSLTEASSFNPSSFPHLSDHQVQSFPSFKKESLSSQGFPGTPDPVQAVLIIPSFTPTSVACFTSVTVLSPEAHLFFYRHFSPIRRPKNRDAHYLSLRLLCLAQSLTHRIYSRNAF